MADTSQATARATTGMVRIAKDLADALAVIARAQEKRVDEVIDEMFRAKIVAAYPKACKQLERAAPLPVGSHDLGGES